MKFSVGTEIKGVIDAQTHFNLVTDKMTIPVKKPTDGTVIQNGDGVEYVIDMAKSSEKGIHVQGPVKLYRNQTQIATLTLRPAS